jgi:transcription elongation GreA/GreB family factor
MTFKQQILQYYQQLINDKVDAFQDMILALTEDSKNDAKGSAGDKHETALSMMHIEQEKLNRKLSEILLQKVILDKIDASSNHNKIALGSVIQTNGMLLFMSTALPKIVVDNKTIIAVSPQSPLGSKLLGNEVGFDFEINGSKYLIEVVS